MPDRILRAGILTSDAVCGLPWAAEVFYRRLHSIVDDFGRYNADPRLLRAALYPLQLAKVNDSDVSSWLALCEKAGLVRVYLTQGKRILEVIKFDQRLRAKRSKWPDPERGNPLSSADKCGQVSSNAAESDTESDTETPKAPKGAVVEVPPDLKPDEESIRIWLAYKRELGKGYKSRGLTMLWKRLREIPQPSRKPAIEHSMANNWAGIYEPTKGKVPGKSWIDEEAEIRKRRAAAGRCTNCGGAIEPVPDGSGAKWCGSCHLDPPKDLRALLAKATKDPAHA